MSIDKAFEELINKYKEKNPLYRLEILAVVTAKEFFTAGAKYMLDNLPKCETCKHWTVIKGGKYYKDHWGKCDSGALYLDDEATPKDFGCIDHSELEKLRES